MKKLFTLFLALAASVGTMFASVKIGDLYYNLDATNLTAEVTYQEQGSENNYSGLTSIVIPSIVTYYAKSYSVISIGEHTFTDCYGLTSVTIPNSVTSIGKGAFAWCSALTSIIIPNSVTSIGEYAFEWCSALTSIIIPNSVTNIGYSAFPGCYGLTSIVVENGNAVYDSRNNCNAIIETATNTLIYGCQNTIIPYSVTSIGEHAFYNCSALTSIIIPNSVTSIGEYAFEWCSALTSIIIPNSVTNIGEYAFKWCSALTSIIIPNSVTSIGSSAFMACEALTSLSILNPDVQYNSYGSMFQNCPQLKKIIAPACIFDASDEDVNKRQAYLAHNLDSIVVTGGQLTENALWFITLSRKTLKSIDFSATTHTSLTDEAFNEFYNLISLKLPANLTHVGYKMVAECVKLKSIDIPASVTEIDDRAFEDCRSIETITFGGVQSASVAGIKKSSSSSQLQRIGNWAFYNAHELQHLDIPEGVTEIGDGAFYGCTYLEDLILPSSVQSIGDNCFALCGKLTKIVVNSTTPPSIAAKTFYDVKRQIPVYVPENCVNDYKNDPLWGEFNIIGQSEAPEAIENVSAIHGESTKLLHNGQFLILSGDKTYTLTGQEVK